MHMIRVDYLWSIVTMRQYSDIKSKEKRVNDKEKQSSPIFRV